MSTGRPPSPTLNRSSTRQSSNSGRPLVIALAIYWLAMVLALHWPPVETPVSKLFGIDKLGHMMLYGGFAILLLRNLELALPGAGRSTRRWPLLLVTILLVAAQGAVDEATQPWTGRTADIVDWIADMAGAVMAVAVFSRIAFDTRRKRRG